MLWGVAWRRVTASLFVVALITLLVVPVGSAARLTHTQTAAGPTHSKAVASPARTNHTASHLSPTDHFQLDPVTPTAAADEPAQAEPATIAHLSPPPVEGKRGVPAARGPPAL